MTHGISGSRRDAFLLGLLVLGAFAHLAMYHPLLPERVASHFDASGTPDGWQSKSEFTVLVAATYAMTGGLFLVLGRFLPSMPVSMVNIPNREYWLAPKRSRETLEEITRRMMRIGSATMVLMIAIFHGVFQVNTGEADTMPGMGLVMAVYALYTVVWCVGLIRRFRRPRAAPGD